MITFKQYLGEASFDAKWLRAAYTHVFPKNNSMEPSIPFTPKIVHTLSKKKLYAFHVTSTEYLPTLLSSQKKKNTISVATKGTEEFFYGGVHHDGVICVVRGIIPFGRVLDIASVPDKSGIRWISAGWAYGGDDHIKRMYKKLYEKFLSMVMKDFNLSHVVHIQDEINNGNIPLSEINRYMRIYMLLAEKFIKKYPPTVDSSHELYGNDTMPDQRIMTNNAYNEFIMAYFTIEHVLIDSDDAYMVGDKQTHAKIKNTLNVKGISYESYPFQSNASKIRKEMSKWKSKNK